MSLICEKCGTTLDQAIWCPKCEPATATGPERDMADLERLAAAAQPFARIGWPAELEDVQPVGLGDLTVGDFRRLAAAMKGEPDDTG